MPQSLQSFREDSLPSKAKAEKAQVLLKGGHYEAALQYFRQADISETSSVDSYVWQAVCLIYLERFQSAVEVCDRALAVDSGHPRVWLFRGVACQRLGRWRDAYACYDRATGQQSQTQVRFTAQWKTWLRALKTSIKGIFNSHHSNLRIH